MFADGIVLTSRGAKNLKAVKTSQWEIPFAGNKVLRLLTVLVGLGQSGLLARSARSHESGPQCRRA